MLITHVGYVEWRQGIEEFFAVSVHLYLRDGAKLVLEQCLLVLRRMRVSGIVLWSNVLARPGRVVRVCGDALHASLSSTSSPPKPIV